MEFDKKDLENHKQGYEEVNRLSERMLIKSLSHLPQKKLIVESLTERARRRVGVLPRPKK